MLAPVLRSWTFPSALPAESAVESIFSSTWAAARNGVELGDGDAAGAWAETTERAAATNVRIWKRILIEARLLFLDEERR